MARENKPSIIFIDEVDALCGPRGEGESEASRRIKTEMLVQMDGVGKDSEGVLVLGATNIPWQLDSAIRRRFQKRVHISLPDVAARADMFKISVGETPTELSSDDYRKLALKSEGFSGSDISIVVQDALMQPIRKIQQATHFKRVSWVLSLPPSTPITLTDQSSCKQVTCKVKKEDSDEYVSKVKWTPCSPGDKAAQEMTWEQIESDELQEPSLDVRDFERSLASSRPTVSGEDLKRNSEWTAEFGSEGA